MTPDPAYNDPTLSPLDFLLAVTHDDHLPMSVRVDAAAAAAPYCHPTIAPGLAEEPWTADNSDIQLGVYNRLNPRARQ
jgi:hypothetical protein